MSEDVNALSLYNAIPWKSLPISEELLSILSTKRQRFKKLEPILLGSALISLLLVLILVFLIQLPIGILFLASGFSILCVLLENILYIEQIDDYILYKGTWIVCVRFSLACFAILPLSLSLIVAVLAIDYPSSSGEVIGTVVSAIGIYVGWKILEYYSILKPARKKILTRMRMALSDTVRDKFTDQQMAKFLEALLVAQQTDTENKAVLELARQWELPENLISVAFEKVKQTPPTSVRTRITTGVLVTLDRMVAFIGMIIQLFELFRIFSRA